MTGRPRRPASQQGFMLLGLIVAIFLILLVLGIAAPRVARALRRDREVEALRRGNQYVRAIQLYYRKLGHYPGSLDQLEKTNNIRFLRQRYADPMTGKPDWRLIHVGEAKTTVKGFFGQPLSGLPGAAAGLGSAAGSVSAGQPGATNGGSTVGGLGAASSAGSAGSPASGQGGSPGSAAGGAAAGSSFGSATGAGTGSSAPGSTGIGSQSATSFSGGGAPIVGVSSVATGTSIVVLNEQTTYATWEFLYDPRIEQLKQKGALLGGPATGSGTGFGSGSGFGAPAGTAPGASSPATVSSPGATGPTAPTPAPTQP